MKTPESGISAVTVISISPVRDGPELVYRGAARTREPGKSWTLSLEGVEIPQPGRRSAAPSRMKLTARVNR